MPQLMQSYLGCWSKGPSFSDRSQGAWQRPPASQVTGGQLGRGLLFCDHWMGGRAYAPASLTSGWWAGQRPLPL